MKKLLLTISLFYCAFAVKAQDLITKIPSDASAVVNIKGKEITNLVSLNDFSNSKLGQMLGKELNRESKGKVTSLENAGFDFNRNFYYFLDVKEGVFTNCFLIPLNNAQNFKNLLGEYEMERIINENGYSYIQDEYDGTVTLWTDDTLILLFSKDESTTEDYYDDYGYSEDLYEQPSSEEMVIEEIEAPKGTDYEIAVESVEEESTVAPEALEEAAEEAIEESAAAKEMRAYNDKIARQDAERAAKREKREAEQEIERKELAISTLARAKEILAGNYASGSILKNTDYLKSVGKSSAEATAWIGDFGQIYTQALPNYGLLGDMNPYSYFDVEKMYGGMTMTAKLDFDKDNVALRTEYTVDDKMADWYRQMYDGKFNSKFTKYINENRLLGYWSLNMSVEGMLNAYPGLIESLFQDTEENHYSDAVSIGANLFSLLIDEKGAAEILRGDALLVLTDLSERTVTYTDYEYDEDYNSKEVEKTKTETVPDFLFMLTSEQEQLYNKLIRIGVREGELEAMNGMYKITSMGNSAPFDVFLLFKDDMFLMGSSKRDMMAIAAGTFVSKLSGSHKSHMKKNVTSMYINGKKIIAQIPTELYPSDLRGQIGFLTQNTEDVYFTFEKMKGNSMKGEMVWNTATSGHQNSFDYFLNMIEALMPDAR